MTGNIFLVRHGVTNSNLQQKYQGVKEDESLNEAGVEQVLDIASFFIKEKIVIGTIISSNLKRSIQSALILKNQLGIHNPKLLHSDLLNEMNFGIFDGKKKNEVLEMHPSFFKDNPFGFYAPYEEKFPEGESMKDAKLRIFEFFDTNQLTTNQQNYLFVGHNGTNKIVRSYFTDKDLIDFMNYNQYHNQVIVINLQNKQEQIITI